MTDAAHPAPVITVGAYLAHRLVQLGAPHVFGLPGDFNLSLLDEMLTVPDVVWVGNTNELNAAYAADAYARTARTPAALVTTYGVGELSAINGVAGSFAEDVPVVQVTGMPSATQREGAALLHHTLVDGDFDHFVRAYKEVVGAGAVLRAEDATLQIDRTLRAALESSKPVYLGIPSDVAVAEVSSASLSTPLAPSASDPAALAGFRDALAGALSGAEQVTVLAGTQVHRRRAEDLLVDVAGRPGVRVATLAGAKATLPEDHPASIGTYMGAMTTSAAVREAVDSARPLVLAGTVFSDVLTGMFSHRFDVASSIELSISHARVGRAFFDGVHLGDGLAALDEVLAASERAPSAPIGAPDAPEPTPVDDDAPRTQEELWRQVQDWLPGGAIAVADAGTALYGALSLTMHEGTELLVQPIWSAIGFTLPAVLGTCLSAPERQSVLLIGDGAAQLTATELATIWQRGLTPVVVLIDNAGYTIERVIQSPRAVYQDVTAWDWTALPAALAPGVDVLTASASTPAQLRSALAKTTQALGTRPVLLRVVTGPDDEPPLLTALGESVNAALAG